MRDVEYNRDAAVSYAHTWAYKRNPRYADFAGMGGDCTNFVSQALYAGSGIMNYTPTFGWYYRNINDRAPAWTGVQYLYNFLTTNKGVGPVAVTADLGTVEPGDVVQLSFDGSRFAHTAIIVAVSGSPPTPGHGACRRSRDRLRLPSARHIYLPAGALFAHHACPKMVACYPASYNIIPFYRLQRKSVL